MSNQLEFLIEPLGSNRVATNEAIWEFLASRGEGTIERAYPRISFQGKKISGIRVTREEMEVIKDCASQFGFDFRILSVNPRTQEIKKHFSVQEVNWEIEKRKLSRILSNFSQKNG
jgi:hypothetical protein